MLQKNRERKGFGRAQRKRHSNGFILRGPLVDKARASPLAKRQFVSIFYRLETARTPRGLVFTPFVERIEILGDPKSPPVLIVDELTAKDIL